MVSDKNIMAYSLHPGVIFTNILRTFLYESPIVDFVVAVVMWPLTKTLEAGAQTTIFCATEDAEKLVSGHFYKYVHPVVVYFFVRNLLIFTFLSCR